MDNTIDAGLTARNKQLVREFYGLVFVDHKPRVAAARYLGPHYIRHHPDMHDGPEAFTAFCDGNFVKFPAVRPSIKHMVAEEDLVCLHLESRRSPQDRGRAIMDIFRVDNGKLVGHWDRMQETAESNSNSNGIV